MIIFIFCWSDLLVRNLGLYNIKCWSENQPYRSSDQLLYATPAMPLITRNTL
jgi:hypothetical protein